MDIPTVVDAFSVRQLPRGSDSVRQQPSRHAARPDGRVAPLALLSSAAQPLSMSQRLCHVVSDGSDPIPAWACTLAHLQSLLPPTASDGSGKGSLHQSISALIRCRS